MSKIIVLNFATFVHEVRKHQNSIFFVAISFYKINILSSADLGADFHNLLPYYEGKNGMLILWNINIKTL